MQMLISFYINTSMVSQESYIEMEIPTHLPLIGDTWMFDSIAYQVSDRVWRSSSVLDIYLIATPEVDRG